MPVPRARQAVDFYVGDSFVWRSLTRRPKCFAMQISRSFEERTEAVGATIGAMADATATRGTNDDEFVGAKVFSATKASDRSALGDRVTAWMGEHPEHEIVDKVVTQSSDRTFHCIAITLFWRTKELG
jgi:hypothetical protein